MNRDLCFAGILATGEDDGIHCRNISGVKIGSPNADISTTGTPEAGNSITFNTMSENLENRGIWVQNCVDAELNDNIIYNVDLYTSAGFSAIEIADVVNGRLRRNVVGGVGTLSGIGLLVRNSCMGTVLECNSFSGFKSGMHLVNGNLPQQGDPPSTPTGNDGYGWLNQWSSDIDPDYRVVGNTNNGNPIPWYHTGSGTSDFSPAQAITPVVFPQANQTNNIDCEDPPLRIMDRDFELGPIVADTISYSVNESASRYINRRKSFEQIASDTSILSTGRSIDSSFVTFYWEMQKSNVNLLRLPQNMEGLDIDSLYTLNENINDTIDVETNQKLINSIHLYALAASSNYSVEDTAALTEISVQPSSAMGSPVYESWAMLFKEVHEPIPEMRLMGTSNGNVNLGQLNAKNSFYIFPNPANTHLNLVHDEKSMIHVVEIYDIVGKLVWKQSNPETIINIQWLEEGTYVVRVYDSSERHYQRKFVKIK